MRITTKVSWSPFSIFVLLFTLRCRHCSLYPRTSYATDCYHTVAYCKEEWVALGLLSKHWKTCSWLIRAFRNHSAWYIIVYSCIDTFPVTTNALLIIRYLVIDALISLRSPSALVYSHHSHSQLLFEWHIVSFLLFQYIPNLLTVNRYSLRAINHLVKTEVWLINHGCTMSATEIDFELLTLVGKTYCWTCSFQSGLFNVHCSMLQSSCCQSRSLLGVFSGLSIPMQFLMYFAVSYSTNICKTLRGIFRYLLSRTQPLSWAYKHTHTHTH